MSLDPTKIQFETVDHVDKIAVYSTMLDSSGFGIGADGYLNVNASSHDDYLVTHASIPNPYGKRCLPTMSWSLDHANYYPANVPIFFYDSVNQGYYWQALGFVGCSDSSIYLCCTSAYGSTQKMYIQFALDSPT